MKTKKLICAALSAVTLLGMSVFADTINVSYNPETELYTLSGTIDDVTVSDMVSVDIYKGEALANALAADELNYRNVTPVYNAAKANILEKKGDEPESALKFTDCIIRYADRANQRINEIRAMRNFEGKLANLEMYRYILDKTCSLAMTMMKYEEPDQSRAFLTYTKETTKTVYQGSKYTVEATLENLRNKDFDGEAVWTDENGEEIGERVPLKVKSGSSETFKVTGKIPMIREEGDYIYYIKYIENGEVVKVQEMNIIFKTLVDFSLKASEKTLAEMGVVSVNLDNTFDDNLKGKVKLEGPEGWSFVKDEQELDVEGGKSVQLDFEIKDFKRKAFNAYYFNIRVYNEDGEEIAHKTAPLDFRISVREEGDFDLEGFDGDISGWENAYPIYVAAPENSQDINSWYGQNVAMKMLGKWNENNFYIMADVYDNIQNNSHTGFNMWQGDCVQIAIDTYLNGLKEGTKSGYQEDDYEFGVAITAKGQESYLYYGPGARAGEMSQLIGKAIRDDEHKLTRYLIKLTKDQISELKLATGTLYGFNIAVNDADVLDRDGFIEYSAGLIDTKNPSLFKRFVLVESDAKAKDFTNDNTGFLQKVDEIRISN